MTGRFHYDYKTGRMKDTQSDFQATKDMRLIERQINDACYDYEKRIEELEKKYNHLLEINDELVKLNNKNQEENESLKDEIKFLKNKVATYKTGNALLKATLDKERGYDG